MDNRETDVSPEVHRAPLSLIAARTVVKPSAEHMEENKKRLTKTSTGAIKVLFRTIPDLLLRLCRNL
jgi:hypothetical protein